MYKFDPAGSSVEATFRAIAASQLDSALGELDKGNADGRSAVHEARRRCKKLRGLLQLVRPVFPDFARENAAIRDAASLLSHLRDAEVLRQTIGELARWRQSEALERIEQNLATAYGPGNEEDRLEAFRTRLKEVRDRVPGWTLRKTGCEALLPGLRLTYRQARKRMHKAARTRQPLDFHEWRKASKYHGFHLDLMRETAPDVLTKQREVVDRLSAELGRHHDLAVLADAVREDPDRFGTAEDVEVLKTTIAARMVEIEDAALALGRQTLAEKPKALRLRFASYWTSAA